MESSEGADKSWQVAPVNFVTEVWFMSHLLIGMVAAKLEKQYEQIAKMINEAAHKKDLGAFEEYMGVKMCIDAHLVGKNTLANFRSLFTFSNALFLSMNNAETYL
jgi:Ubiquitin elongating factor core